MVDVAVLGPRIGAASAMKLAYAAWTKGTIALLIAAHDFAVARRWMPTCGRSGPSPFRS